MPAISFSGLASGIDGDAIVKALGDSKRLATIPLQNRLEEHKSENTALEEFRTKLLALNSKVQPFTSLSGGTLAKQATSSNSDALTATVSSSAISSSLSVNILSLAKPATLSFDDEFSSNTEPLFPSLTNPATIEFQVGEGDKQKTYSINVDATTTLNSLAQSITDTAAGVLQASVINKGTAQNPQYILLVNGLSTGTQDGLLSFTVDSAITDLGLFSAHTLEQAQNARVDVSGIGEVTRPSNQISDLLPGITLLLKAENTGPVQLTISNDVDKTATKVQELVDALNEIIKHSRDNSKISRVETESGAQNLYGSLAKTKVDNQAASSITSALYSAGTQIPNSAVKIFADIGVTIGKDGPYQFDADKFKEAASANPAAVDDILSSFADKVGSTTGVIASYTKFFGQIDLAKKSNDESDLVTQDRIDRIETLIARQEDMLKRQFVALEQRVSELNAGANSLITLLGGLSSSPRR